MERGSTDHHPHTLLSSLPLGQALGQTGTPPLSLLLCWCEAYEEILDISLFLTLILTFSCCSLSMANTGDEVIYLHYSFFVTFYKKV